MRGAAISACILAMMVLSLGCTRSDEILAIQSDLTLLENRIQRMEGGALRETQAELSTIAQSQRNQSGTMEQSLARISKMERDLDTITRQQRDILERLERLESSQLRDSQAIRSDLDGINRNTRDNMTASLNSLRQEFNAAQTEMAKTWERRIATLQRDTDNRIKKLDDEITNFYRELQRTIRGHAQPGESYSSGVYTVSPGDSLSKIAQQLGVSADELARVNNISDPSKIYVGQQLTIP